MTYHIFVYGLLLRLINIIFGKNGVSQDIKSVSDTPSITVLCAAFNEEKHIEEKIKSFLALNYPADKINMIVISDDSIDATNDIVQQFKASNVELVVQKPRRGKQCAYNLVMPSITTDYVLSTDANSIFEPEAINHLVTAMMNNSKIGIVSGELVLRKPGSKDSGEGLYWKYESFLKNQESTFESIIGANGSIFLIKRELFTKIDPASVDDFERTMYVLSRGYIAKYVPAAIVYEDVTEIAMEEFSRKVRIVTQEWFALVRNIQLLNPFKHAKVSFMLISHKLIRWLLFLFAFLALLTTGLIKSPFYNVIFGIQVFFYIVGFIEVNLQKRDIRIPYANIIAYFVTMCAASLVAFVRFMFKQNIGMWNPVRKDEG